MHSLMKQLEQELKFWNSIYGWRKINQCLFSNLVRPDLDSNPWPLTYKANILLAELPYWWPCMRSFYLNMLQCMACTVVVIGKNKEIEIFTTQATNLTSMVEVHALNLICHFSLLFFIGHGLVCLLLALQLRQTLCAYIFGNNLFKQSKILI